ncbi:hypothetical protein Golax_011066 [Gossypium laxum]|uniref:Secreted protein n=1 Tax=Gossypium laxum TaxID=34288 RepID=A0A7J8ZJD5_9ROSI|nr:hypothetical protein [Gossypium laxum]
MRKLLNTRLELLLVLVWLRPLMWSSHLATPDLTLHRPLSPRCSTFPPRLTRVLSKLSLRLSLSRRVTKLVLLRLHSLPSSELGPSRTVGCLVCL